MPRFIAIGCITKDVVRGKTRLGGSALFASLTARALGYEPEVVTAVDDSTRDEILRLGIPVVNTPAKATLTFVHDYVGDVRKSCCTQNASRIDVPGLSSLEPSDIVFVCPNMHELEPQDLIALSNRRWTFLPQGWFRSIAEDGTVRSAPAKHSNEGILASLVVASQEDLMGDPKGFDWCAKAGKKFVLTRGSGPMTLVESVQEDRPLPWKSTDVVDPTGAGDTFSAVVTLCLAAGKTFLESVEYGSIAASIKVERRNVFDPPSMEQIEERYFAKKNQR